MANKGMKSPAKIAIGTFAGLVVLVGAVVGGFNIYIRANYAQFYDEATDEFGIPGLDTGFVPQDIARLDDGTWIFSGYAGNGGPSPIWRIAPDGKTSMVILEDADGRTYEGHGGGVTCDGEFVYLTCENGYLGFPANEVASAADGGTVRALGMVDVGFTPAFINICDGKLYTGVFYREPEYPTPQEMHLTAPDGTENHAVMYAYDKAGASGATFNFEDAPSAVYSIPDLVQGVAIVPDGNFAFSTSWAISPSHLLVYNGQELSQSGEYMVNGDAVPLYFFDNSNLVRSVQAPPMLEGIIVHDGKVYMANESACNKYIFGKLYDGGRVYSISL